MLRRLSHLIQALFHLHHLFVLEATLVSLFWIQALRFLVGSLYSRVASASIVAVIDPAVIAPETPGIVQPAVVSGELNFLLYMIALPLLVLLLGRVRWLMIGAVILVAAGRVLMLTGGESISATLAAALVLGGGLVYIGMVIRHRALTLPYMFILGLALDQVFRAVGNTLDPSWSSGYANTQTILSLVAIGLSVYTTFNQQRAAGQSTSRLSNNGLLTLWGGISLGALLFLQLSLLASPNAVAGRAEADYTSFVPAVLVATMLPLVPWVRNQARAFIALFDNNVRGWAWMLIIALLVVIGVRIQTIEIGGVSRIPIGGASLIIAQLGISLIWWWLARPQAEKERNLTGLWLVGTVGVFVLLVVLDNFTYDYAYVRNLSPELAFLNNVIPPLLRGFRGMGLAIILLGVFLAAAPMVQTRQRIPWLGGAVWQSLLAVVVITGFSVGATLAARPPVISGVRDVDRIRIGTYNIHSGYNEFFHYDLEAIARTIQKSGANVVLLQELENGRMTSFGVDQALWLARRLGMDTRTFPTNEGLQGLAVLSNIEIVFSDGQLLSSTTNQTGLQRVQIRPDTGVITLYNTWLGLLGAAQNNAPVDDSEQQQQLTEILAIISSQHPTGLGRTIIGGTFNNVPDSPLIQRMRDAGFQDPFAGQPIELAATLRRIGSRAKFDYIWTRTPLLPLGASVMDSAATDHRMAVAELLITGRADQ